MKYELTRSAYYELQALYSGIWTLKYDSSLNEDDRKLIKDCISMNFEMLDNKYKVPFWVQNKVISYADKKSSIDYYLDTLLKKDNIIVK